MSKYKSISKIHKLDNTKQEYLSKLESMIQNLKDDKTPLFYRHLSDVEDLISNTKKQMEKIIN